MKNSKITSILFAAILAISLFAGCSTVPKVDIKGVDDLANKKIGVQEGTTGDVYVTDNIEGAVISRFKKPTDAALELKNGKVDAVVLDELPAKKIVEKNSDLMILDGSLTTEQYAIGIKKDNTELLDKVNTSLARMKDDGTYEALFNYFVTGEGTEIPEIPEYTPNGTLTMCTNAEFEPFEYRSDDNEIIGFDIEIAKQIAYDMGVELKVEDMDFNSLLAAVQSGKADLAIAGITADDERRLTVDFSDNYFDSTQVIIVRK